MALNWKDKIDGVDYILAEDINAVAHFVEEIEENAEKTENKVSKIEKGYGNKNYPTVGAVADYVDNVQLGIEESISQINNYIGTLNDRASNIESDVSINSQRISFNSKRILNLEAGIPADDFVTDNSASYVRDVPSNALPFAEVSEIGGVTRKCSNLIKFPYVTSSGTIGGVTYTINADGSISLNGTANSGSAFYLMPFDRNHFNIGATYTVSGGASILFSGYRVEGGTFTLTEDHFTKSTNQAIRLRLEDGVTYNGTVYPMFNEGSTALPYEPYFSGLRSAPVSEVVSEGANSWNNEIAEYSDTDSFTRTSSGFIFKRSENLQGRGAYAYVKHPIKAGDTVVFNFTGATYAKYLYSDQIYGNQITAVPAGRELIYTADVDYPNALFAVVINSQDPDGEVSDITLNYDTSQPYTPYIKRTLTLPEAVQALPDYGVGIPNTDYFNRIRWRYDEQTDKWVREYYRPMKTVDMGTLTWQHKVLSGDRHTFYTSSLTDLKINEDSSVPINAICAPYRAVATNATWVSGDMGYDVINKNILDIVDNNYTDATSFKSAMSGVILCYALTTPEITDISDLLPEDNLIGVEGGGTITMQNAYGYDVPATVTYQVEEASV